MHPTKVTDLVGHPEKKSFRTAEKPSCILPNAFRPIEKLLGTGKKSFRTTEKSFCTIEKLFRTIP
jgi:hypothetical protein